MQDAGNVANTRRSLTVHAHSGNRAGVGTIQPFVIDWSGNGFDALHGCIQVGNDFIHADNDNYFFRPKTHGGHPVSRTIGIDQLSVKGDSIGAGKKNVAQ